MSPAADKLALEILQICNAQARNTMAGRLINRAKIINQFSSSEKAGVKSVINNYLLKMKYLEKVDDEGSDPVYAITKRGELQLSNYGTNNLINIGDNSNAVINSPGAIQNIKVINQTAELQQLIADFDDAVAAKDSDSMKRTFGYIADKSVDVAIALVTGALLR